MQQAPGLEVVDKRAFPRKACALNCSGNNDVIKDISVCGVRLESTSSYDIDQKLDLAFSIPSVGGVKCTGQITRIEENADVAKRHYGIRFVTLNGKDQKKIKHYILNRVKKDELGELRQRFLSSERENVVEISEPVRIQSLLKGVMESEAKLTVFQEGTLEGYLEGTVKQIDDEIIKVVLDTKSRVDSLSFATPFSVYFDYSYHGYFFETRLNAIPQGELHLRLPLKIYYSDKRRDKRIPVTEGTFEFPIPHPVNAIYKAKLIDYSESGAAFKAPMKGFYFLPDTPLKPVKISAGEYTKEGLRGEVRYLTPLDHDHYKVGVEFSNLSRKGFEIERAAATPKRNLKRSFEGLINKLRVGAYLTVSRRIGKKKSVVENPNLQLQVVRFKNLVGQELVGLVNSTMSLGRGRVTAPVVIIPPAYTKRKETTSALALTLIHNFKKRGKDLIVIRIDFTNATGESYVDEENHVDGRNYLHFTPQGACDDILATIKFCENNQLFSSNKMALVALSFASPMARKAILQDKTRKIKYWINVMGTPHLQELVKNSGGGVDYIGNLAKGIKPGIVNFLGELVDFTNYCQNCIDSGMAYLKDTREDMEKINIPVTWIYGKYDSWVNSKAIKDVMSIESSYPREVIEASSGHLPVTTDEAFSNFRIVTKHLWKHLVGEDIESDDPDPVTILRVREMEWNRIPKMRLGDSTSYWKSYLLGEGGKDIGYDILSLTDEYRQLMIDQIEELDIRGGEIVADVSTGTGNFLNVLWEKLDGKLPDSTFVMTDFIPEALERAKGKHAFLNNAGVTREYRLLNLELSRLLPFISFVNGEFPGVTDLKGRIEGLTDYSLQIWQDRYSLPLHKILRGEKIGNGDIDYLGCQFDDAEVEKILEFNQASRLARALVGNDLEGFKRLLDSFSFEHLVINTSAITSLNYPLGEKPFDKILLSLVASYVFDPYDIVKKLFLSLKPGGKIVLSSFKVDPDMTTWHSNLIKKIESMAVSPFPGTTKEDLLVSARQYANNAARLLRLGDEGTFQFFTEEQLKNLMIEAGFRSITIRRSFGHPSQVFIASGIKE